MVEVTNFHINNFFVNYDEFKSYLENLQYELVTKNTREKIAYINLPCAFDIETSSFYENKEKRAIMYAFTLGINGVSILGRGWGDFEKYINLLVSTLTLSDSKRLIIYVHNLAYEFQFLRKRFNFEKVFAISERTPVYALTDIGVEFRCSYILSGYSLKVLGNNLHKFKVQKMVGDLDYSLIRHEKSYLSDKEKGYILNDGLVVMAYIEELIEEYGNILKLPLTQTGFVREYCRKRTIYHTKNEAINKYQKSIFKLTIEEPLFYKQLKRAFQGGFTHANLFNVNKVFKDVTSYDFTSSYPAVMLMEEYPMSTFYRASIKSIEEFYNYLNKYCCIFDITFYDLEKTNYTDTPLSYSKCFNVSEENLLLDNGRVFSAKKLTTTITEQDFFIYQKFYKWSKIEVFNFRYAFKNYLPSKLIKCILKLYGDKTTLKGVEGKEKEYLNSKGMLNSIYGMSVTDIVRASVEYNEETDTWSKSLKEDEEIEEILKRYNKDWKRFLYYPWGIWVTAYARRNLFTGILELGSDYIYSDTDSIKGINFEKHLNYINNYNKEVEYKLKLMCNHYDIDFNLCKPKTIKGEEKLIGVWDFDGHYKRFKTLGAKRYMVETSKGKIEYTIAGLPKNKCVDFITKQGEGDAFNYFSDNMLIPSEESNKKLLSYIDFETKGKVRDYVGNTYYYHEYNSVHMENTMFTLTLSKDYISIMKDRRNLRRID